MTKYDNTTLQQMAAQIRQLEHEVHALRAEVTRLRTADPPAKVKTDRNVDPVTTRTRTTSRRRLLASAGATAAAATVALVASEGQGVRAASMAPAADGGNLQLGSGGDANNTASTTTTLSVDTLANVSPLFKVDASTSANASPTAIAGIANGPGGTGVSGTGTVSGVHGESTGAGGSGIYGHSTLGAGVYGQSTASFGMLGASSSGIGVQGTSNGTAVSGISGTGIGVYASSGAAVDLYAAGSGRIQQNLQVSPGAPSGTLVYFNAGESVRDKNGDLFICVASGAPAIWQQVIGAGGSAAATGATTLTNTSASGAGLDVTATGGDGIRAIGGSGWSGVYGTTSGTGDLDVGVFGAIDAGFGVVAISSTGVDLMVGDLFGGAQNRLWQIPQQNAGAPTLGSYETGEQLRDANGELWLCIASGTPGTWVRALHVLPGLAGGAISFLTKPTRLLDTRGDSPNAFQNGGGPFTGGPLTLQVAGVNNPNDGVSIPSNAFGAIGKVTVLASSGSGYVALVPSGSGAPNTGTLPYGNGASLVAATSFTVGLGGSPGSVDVYVPGDKVDLVIDIFGVVA